MNPSLIFHFPTRTFRSVEKYQKKLEKLDSRLDDVLKLMRDAGDRALHKAPIVGAWTPLQTLHHIYLVERTSVDYLLYKFGQEEEPPSANFRSRLNGKMLVAAFASPKKFKSPEALDSRNIVSSKSLTLESLSYDLRMVRNELEDILRTAPDAWHKSAVYRHPVVGRMSLKDMLTFFNSHQTRHFRQIKRALAQNARNNRRQKTS